MRRSFVVTIDIPPGATIEDVRHYIWDAVGTMKGCLRPYDPHNEDHMERGDPMSELNGDSAKVVTKRRRAD